MDEKTMLQEIMKQLQSLSEQQQLQGEQLQSLSEQFTYRDKQLIQLTKATNQLENSINGLDEKFSTEFDSLERLIIKRGELLNLVVEKLKKMNAKLDARL